MAASLAASPFASQAETVRQRTAATCAADPGGGAPRILIPATASIAVTFVSNVVMRFDMGSNNNNNNNNAVAVVLVLLLVFLVLIGLFVVLCALVVWIQDVIQRYLELKVQRTLYQDLQAVRAYRNN
eukprot:Skav220963  [mRNA]  locus=scaffold1928:246677:261206:+ [translate_table: standard]